MDEKKAPQQRREALEQIRREHSDNGAQSQATRMEAALRALGSITTFEASRFLDIYHPPARALALRKRGLSIITLREPVITESGKAHSVGRYVLATVPAERAGMADPNALDGLDKRPVLLGIGPEPSTLTNAQQRAIYGLLERCRRGG